MNDKRHGARPVINCPECGAVCSVSHMHNGHHARCLDCDMDWGYHGMSDEHLKEMQLESLMYRIEKMVKDALGRVEAGLLDKKEDAT